MPSFRRVVGVVEVVEVARPAEAVAQLAEVEVARPAEAVEARSAEAVEARSEEVAETRSAEAPEVVEARSAEEEQGRLAEVAKARVVGARRPIHILKYALKARSASWLDGGRGAMSVARTIAAPKQPWT
jgi:hypothetical protein